MVDRSDEQDSMPEEELLSIGALAERTGIPTPTLRMWERRYNLPEPIRLPSGHRRYPLAEVTRLRRIAEALALGHRPAEITSMDEGELDRLLAEEGGAQFHYPGMEGLLELVAEYRETNLLDRVQEAWDSLPLIEFMEGFITPLMTEAGRRWADGRFEVRHEHFLSHLVEDFLRSRRMAFRNSSGSRARPQVLITTLAGERHSTSLEMLALLCEFKHIPYRILGIDSPSIEIALAARELQVKKVLITVSLASSLPEVLKHLRELRQLLPEGIRILVGGGGIHSRLKGPRGIEPVLSLADLQHSLGS